jgi:hypothetical protein
MVKSASKIVFKRTFSTIWREMKLYRDTIFGTVVRQRIPMKIVYVEKLISTDGSMRFVQIFEYIQLFVESERLLLIAYYFLECSFSLFMLLIFIIFIYTVANIFFIYFLICRWNFLILKFPIWKSFILKVTELFMAYLINRRNYVD